MGHQLIIEMLNFCDVLPALFCETILFMVLTDLGFFNIFRKTLLSIERIETVEFINKRLNTFPVLARLAFGFRLSEDRRDGMENEEKNEKKRIKSFHRYTPPQSSD